VRFLSLLGYGVDFEPMCREKISIQANVIDQLVAGAQSDIRQVLNMLSTWKLSNDSMNFDEGKSLCVTEYIQYLFVV
jgi:hypothetical protein